LGEWVTARVEADTPRRYGEEPLTAKGAKENLKTQRALRKAAESAEKLS